MLAFTGTSLSVLSFRDEDVGRSIELLCISPAGTMTIEAIEQGKLFQTVGNYSCTSNIIKEDEDER
jgi:hypothetical protein